MQRRRLALCGLCVMLLAGVAVVFLGNVGLGDCGPGTQVESASSPPSSPNNTLTFQELNATQRDVVRDAVECNAQFAPDSKWLNLSRWYPFSLKEPFEEAEYVRYDGNRYEIVFSRGEFFATYGISASVTTPTEGASVTTFGDLPSRIRDEMKQALTTGYYSAPPGKWGSLPESLDTGNYVRYRNQTYEISVVVGDGRVNVMTLERGG